MNRYSISPGPIEAGLSRFSEYLQIDAVGRRDIRELQGWIIENVRADMRVGEHYQDELNYIHKTL